MKLSEAKTKNEKLKNQKNSALEGLRQLKETGELIEVKIQDRLGEEFIEVIGKNNHKFLYNISVDGALETKGPFINIELDSLNLIYSNEKIEIRPIIGACSPSMTITDIHIQKIKEIIENVINNI